MEELASDIPLSIARLVLAHATSFLLSAALLVLFAAGAMSIAGRGRMTDAHFVLVLTLAGFLGGFAAHALW